VSHVRRREMICSIQDRDSLTASGNLRQQSNPRSLSGECTSPIPKPVNCSHLRLVANFYRLKETILSSRRFTSTF
jgi:hypothetical protein